MSLFGHRLCDTLPMGNLTTAGDVHPWSGQFGSTRPAVLVVPDLVSGNMLAKQLVHLAGA